MCFTSLSKQRKLSTHLSEDWKVEWALCFLLTRWDQQKFTPGLLSEISLKKQRNIKHHIGTLHRHKYQLTRAYGDDTFSCKGSPKQVEPHVWFCTCFYAECPSWSNNLIYPGFGLVQYQEYASLWPCVSSWSQTRDLLHARQMCTFVLLCTEKVLVSLTTSEE